MSTDTLRDALARARGQFAPIPKRRTATVRMKAGGQYSYKYADLSDVFEGVDAALSDNGLSIMQTPAKIDGQWMCKTILAHSSGEDEVGFYPIFNREDGTSHPAQNWSAGFQFAKRYGVCGMLGIAAEESIEGDHSFRNSSDPRDTKDNGPLGIDDAFETGDGVRLPKGTKVAANATARQRAEAACEAIVKQFSEPKTAVGVNGVWNRNESFINKFAEKHNDLYQEVFDAFHSTMAKFKDDEPAPTDLRGQLERSVELGELGR